MTSAGAFPKVSGRTYELQIATAANIENSIIILNPLLRHPIDHQWREHQRGPSPTLNKSDPNQPHLGRVQFIDIDHKTTILVRNRQLNHKHKAKYSNIRPYILHLTTILISDEYQYQWAHTDKKEGTTSQHSTWEAVDQEDLGWILRWSQVMPHISLRQSDELQMSIVVNIEHDLWESE